MVCDALHLLRSRTQQSTPVGDVSLGEKASGGKYSVLHRLLYFCVSLVSKLFVLSLPVYRVPGTCHRYLQYILRIAAMGKKPSKQEEWEEDDKDGDETAVKKIDRRGNE